MGLVRGMGGIRGLTMRSTKSNFKKVVKEPLVDTEDLKE